MSSLSESQPLVGGRISVQKYSGLKRETKSFEWESKLPIVYGIVSILLFFVLIFYKRESESIARNTVTHWHTVLPPSGLSSSLSSLNDECPAICGIGYRHSEEIAPLTVDNNQESFSAKMFDESTILVGRIVKNEKRLFNNDNNNNNNENDFWFISQKLNRCVMSEQSCDRNKIDFVKDEHLPITEWEYEKDASLLDGITLKMAIKQKNNDFSKIENVLYDVSDPDSENYGKYWSFDEIHDFFAPNAESHETIFKWLNSYGILLNDIKYLTPNGDFIEMRMSIQQANDLLDTQFGYWKHKETGKRHLRVKESYSVPSEVAQHLDFISPTLRFPVHKHITTISPLPATAGWITDSNGENKQLVDLSKYESASENDFEFVQISPNTPSKILLKKRKKSSDVADTTETETKEEQAEQSDNDSGAQNYDGDDDDDDDTTLYNTPNRLIQLYSMHTESSISSDNSQAIASFLKEWYSLDDIEQFDEFFEIPTSEITNVPDTQPSGYGTEAELDVEYITALGRGIHTYVWDVEDNLYFVSLVQQLESADTRPYIVSMSYGGDEQSNGESYCTRASIEFAKIGLLGVTFFASAGDNGACGSTGACGLTGEYLPSFPASSPFVTAVGGTYGGNMVNSESVEEAEKLAAATISAKLAIDENDNEFTIEEYNSYCQRSTQESAWYNGGGGFSIYFDRPSYQDDAILNYFSSYDFSVNSDKSVETKRFNTNGRGYPDISGQAVNYVVCDESLFWLISGTSAATPSIAGIFGMINDYRLSQNMPSLGFLNPYLYKLYGNNMKELTKNEYYNVKDISLETNEDDNNANGKSESKTLRKHGNGNGNRRNMIEDENNRKKTLVGDEDDMNAVLNGNNEDNDDDDVVYQVSKNIYFNDVIDGYNEGCGETRTAFYAIDGWDPVTGLGTLKYGKLLEQLGSNNDDDDA